MKQEDEQGFLAGKFDDWSGEPIPNGWSSIENKIRKEKSRRNLLIAAIPAILLLSFWLKYGKDSFVPASQKEGSLSQTESLHLPAAAPAEIQKPTHSEGRSSRISFDQRHSSSPQGAELTASTDRKNSTEGTNPNSAGTESGASPYTGFEATEAQQTNELVTGNIAEVSMPDFSPESGFLLPKSAPFLLPDFNLARANPGTVRENKINKAPESWFSKSFTFQAAYAVSTIEIDHALSEGWRYSPAKNNFSRAGMISAGIRMEKPLKRNLAFFYGMEAGLFMRETELLATSKTPVSYSILQDGDSRFSVNPELKSQNEIRRSTLVFARSEIGIRQALTRHSGFLAAGQCWARMSSASSSSQADAAGFQASGSSFAFGYRAGAWMQTGPFTQVEFSYSYMPESLAASTAGLQFRTRMLGLSLKQTF